MRFASVLAIALALAACKKSEPPAPPPQPQGAVPAPQAGAIKGKVAERIDAAPYSYLRLTTAQGELWAAVPQSNVANGAEVTVEGPMAMDGWESKTLNRKFEKLVFGTLAGQAPPAGAPGAAAAPAAPAALRALDTPRGARIAPRPPRHASIQVSP